MAITLTGGKMPLGMALETYERAWKAFLVVRRLERLEREMRPVAISWKVQDKNVLFDNLARLGPATDQVHIGTVNDRFIASVLLTRPTKQNVQIIKILERRSGSMDLLGLDSIDYLVEDSHAIYQTLKKAGAGVEKDSNDMHDWVSLRFGKNNEFETKFVDHLLLDVGVKELKAAADKLREKLNEY